MQAYLVYLRIKKPLLAFEEAVVVVTASSSDEAITAVKLRESMKRNVDPSRIQIEKVLTKPGITPEELIAAWNQLPE